MNSSASAMRTRHTSGTSNRKLKSRVPGRVRNEATMTLQEAQEKAVRTIKARIHDQAVTMLNDMVAQRSERPQAAEYHAELAELEAELLEQMIEACDEPMRSFLEGDCDLMRLDLIRA